jgi:hypothetical protein
MTPSTPPPADARELGRRRLAERRRRIHRIRARVAAAAAATFLAVFSGLYVQMASGHDPALGASATTGSSTAMTTESQTTTTTQSTPQSMTTRQS